jgi:type VI secretion system secreted protein Hcp
VPTDTISINFAKIEFEYKPQLPDGTLGSAVTAGWDLKKNKKV